MLRNWFELLLGHVSASRIPARGCAGGIWLHVYIARSAGYNGTRQRYEQSIMNGETI